MGDNLFLETWYGLLMQSGELEHRDYPNDNQCKSPRPTGLSIQLFLSLYGNCHADFVFERIGDGPEE